MQKTAILMLVLGTLLPGLCEAGRHNRQFRRSCQPATCCTVPPAKTARPDITAAKQPRDVTGGDNPKTSLCASNAIIKLTDENGDRIIYGSGFIFNIGTGDCILEGSGTYRGRTIRANGTITITPSALIDSESNNAATSENAAAFSVINITPSAPRGTGVFIIGPDSHFTLDPDSAQLFNQGTADRIDGLFTIKSIARIESLTPQKLMHKTLPSDPAKK